MSKLQSQQQRVLQARATETILLKGLPVANFGHANCQRAARPDQLAAADSVLSLESSHWLLARLAVSKGKQINPESRVNVT